MTTLMTKAMKTGEKCVVTMHPTIFFIEILSRNQYARSSVGQFVGSSYLFAMCVQYNLATVTMKGLLPVYS